MWLIFISELSALTSKENRQKSKYLLYKINTSFSSFGYSLTDVWGAYNKFPDFFHMGTFIDSTHMKL